MGWFRIVGSLSQPRRCGPTLHTDATETYLLCYDVERGSHLKRGVQDGAGCLGALPCTLLIRIQSTYLTTQPKIPLGIDRPSGRSNRGRGGLHR